MVGRSLKYGMASAAALALLMSSPASAQLDQRLTEAGQKLDSDVQGCRPINMGDYSSLLREAAENKQRADRAARKGVPVDQAKVDADLANAQSLFNRANAALVQQCIRNTTQPQTAPQVQTTGAAAGAKASPAQGLTPQDEQAIASQQWTVEGFESALGELQGLIRQGKCEQAWDLVDELDEWLDELDGSRPMIRPAAIGPTRIPSRLIDEWDRRIDEIMETCPEPGKPKLSISAILESHNSERAKFGYEPLRWSVRLADNAQTYASQLGATGQLAHASREGRGIERENLSQGMLGWSTKQLLDNWFDERRYFRPGIFPDVSTTGDWYQVGHYSQAIWPTTISIGCGLSYGSGFSWLVCRYSPGGNKDGKPVGQPAQVATASDRLEMVLEADTSAPPIGGEWISSGGTTSQRCELSASLFDLGIYGGGARAADWFESDARERAREFAADYGYDGALFVGYDLGAFRLESDLTYDRSGLDDQPQGAEQASAQTHSASIPARWLAEDIRILWGWCPAPAEFTPPPESVLDDIGENLPPPESVLDDIGKDLPPPK